MVIGEALKKGLIYLENSEYTDPFLESRLILKHLLNKDMSYLFSHFEEELPEDIIDRYFNILERREKGEPLQYILGRTNFYGKEFIVNKNVLIPRNDTEISIEVLKDIFYKNPIDDFLEIGSGTGIVSITMASFYKNCNFLCSDISSDAIKNTQENIKLHNLKNVKVINSDLYSNISGKYDIIYSNPPYIKSSEIDNLQKEVKIYEPKTALDGGEDGLYFYKKIIEGSEKYLKENGFLVFEIGYDQGKSLKTILTNYNVEIYKDLQNRDRVVVGRKGVL